MDIQSRDQDAMGAEDLAQKRLNSTIIARNEMISGEDVDTGLANELFPLNKEDLEHPFSETIEAPLSIPNPAETKFAPEQTELSDLDDLLPDQVEEENSNVPAVVVEDPDRPLTDAFLRGSPEDSERAFIQLYAKYEAPLLFYCKRVLSSDRIAEDAFQDIWIRLFELRMRKELVIGHFNSMLFRSARNLCMNTLRLERLRAGSSDRLTELTALRSSNEDAEELEMKALVRKALSRLPFDQREAFVLHEYSGFTYAEISSITGAQEANVKVRAYRARIRLRKLIQGWLGLGELDDPTNVI